uniref:Peptidase S1 domain-containing protein n=1 Tax=Ornithorhynchus anatinus TaxID=9258 RepID=F7GDR7_ORNAN
MGKPGTLPGPSRPPLTAHLGLPAAASQEPLPGGYTCAPHSQPWQAALMDGDTLRCGATVIHRLWVLTAAHCYRKNYTVLLGKHNLTEEWEPGQQSRWVQRSVPHPSYQSSPTHHNHDHDIMLLRLSRPLHFSDTIRPLNLATNNCLPPGTSCLVSGWGSTTSPESAWEVEGVGWWGADMEEALSRGGGWA